MAVLLAAARHFARINTLAAAQPLSRSFPPDGWPAYLPASPAAPAAAALLGFPPWPSVGWMSRIALDTLIWSSLSLSFHGLSLYLLIYDERRIKFRSMDEEQL